MIQTYEELQNLFYCMLLKKKNVFSFIKDVCSTFGSEVPKRALILNDLDKFFLQNFITRIKIAEKVKKKNMSLFHLYYCFRKILAHNVLRESLFANL